MDEKYLESLLRQLQAGEVSVEHALKVLKQLPYEQIGQVLFDHHRILRKGLPEIIYGPGKTREQLLDLTKRLVAKGIALLVTRLPSEIGKFLEAEVHGTKYNELSRCLSYCPNENSNEKKGLNEGVLVVTAGTADLPVAYEAAECLKVIDVYCEFLVDVGVAGIHRLLDRLDTLFKAKVIIAVAGMEGALPSVMAGIVKAPVIAVPTSVGYGVNMGGLAALFAMLNSCAPGIGVVNIDNGVGAALLAASIINCSNKADHD